MGKNRHPEFGAGKWKNNYKKREQHIYILDETRMYAKDLSTFRTTQCFNEVINTCYDITLITENHKLLSQRFGEIQRKRRRKRKNNK